MAFTHGKAAVCKLDNGAGTLTAITAYVDNIAFNQTGDVAETSVLGLTSKTFVPGLKNATGQIDGPYDPTVIAILQAAIAPAATKSLEIYPQGTTTGLDLYQCEVIGTALNFNDNLSGAGKYTFSFQVTGNVTLTTAP
jgi:hypothetical protein